VSEDARKYALRSEVLLKEGNFEQVATELKKAIQIAPYAARLYYNFALINAELKKYPEAIRHMKIYLKAAPDAPDARPARDEIIKWEFMIEKEGR
jgi:tetratricopeptide (TPR) repeat protein